MRTAGAPGWIYSPLPGQPRWSTALTGLLVFGVVTWRTRRPLYAAAAAMTWLCGYEILYQAMGLAVHRWSIESLVLTTSGTGGWLVAAYLLGLRPDWRLLVAFAALWVAWMAAGYESNMPDRVIPGAALRWSWSDELMNVGTKTLLAAAVLSGALGFGRRSGPSSSPA